MADGIMFGQYDDRRVAFLASEWMNLSSNTVWVLFVSSGESAILLKSEIKIKEQSKHANFKRNKGVVYDNRTSRCSNRVS